MWEFLYLAGKAVVMALTQFETVVDAVLAWPSPLLYQQPLLPPWAPWLLLCRLLGALVLVAGAGIPIVSVVVIHVRCCVCRGAPTVRRVTRIRPQ
jgi:hypothetical protein